MQVKIKYSKQLTTGTKDYPYMFQLSLMENSICIATQEGYSINWKILKNKFIFQKRLIKNTKSYTSTFTVCWLLNRSALWVSRLPCPFPSKQFCDLGSERRTSLFLFNLSSFSNSRGILPGYDVNKICKIFGKDNPNYTFM